MHTSESHTKSNFFDQCFSNVMSVNSMINNAIGLSIFPHTLQLSTMKKQRPGLNSLHNIESMEGLSMTAMQKELKTTMYFDISDEMPLKSISSRFSDLNYNFFK